MAGIGSEKGDRRKRHNGARATKNRIGINLRFVILGKSSTLAMAISGHAVKQKINRTIENERNHGGSNDLIPGGEREKA